MRFKLCCARLEDVLGEAGLSDVQGALLQPGRRILDVQPRDVHERTPVILGRSEEVDHVAAQLG